MKSTILVIHGANLNMLGRRETSIYGCKNLETVNEELISVGSSLGCTVECYHSNIEGELINKIHNSSSVKFIIINAGAFSHTSLGVRDALICVDIPFYEVHISNIYAREEFRRHSYLSDVASGVISGFGTIGYILALKAAVEYLS